MRMRHLVLAGIVAMAAVAGGHSTLRGDPLPASSLNWIFDGPVRGTARLGDTLYVGGHFTRVAPASAAIGSAYAMSPSTGALVPGVFPRVDGTVSAIEPDGAGGYYLGGDFLVPGAPQRTSLARVRSDGALDPAFAAALNGAVVAMARVGGSLFVAGTFTTIGGVPAPGIGAVDATTGARVAWQPAVPIGFQPTALVSSPAGVVVGGREITVSSVVAAIGMFDPVSAATRWYRTAAAGVGVAAQVDAIADNGVTVIVAHTAGVASLDAATGAVDIAFNPGVTGVTALAVAGNVLYLGGSFSSVGGQGRAGLAAVDVATAALLPWNPQLAFGRGVSQLVPTPGGTVVADGVAATGGARRRLVEIDAGGAVTAWAPEAFAEAITALRLGDTGMLLVGSPLAAIGGTARAGLAAFDLPSGTLLGWAPDAAGPANALVAADGVVYAGLFGVGAFDAVTGAAVAGPALGIFGQFLVAHDGWLYGSHFSLPRGPQFMWRYDLQARTMDPAWSLPGSPTAVVGAGSRLILAAAGGLSAIDADTAAPLWSNTAGTASAVAISGDTVYSNLGGTNLTTHDLRTGALLTSTPIGFQPSALTVADGRVVINGSPDTGSPLILRTLTGAPVVPAWEPGLVRTLTDSRGSLLGGDDLLVASGTFGRSASPALQGLAAFPLDGARAPSALRTRFDGPATVLEWDAPDVAPAGYILQAGRTPGATDYALPLGAVTSYSVIPPTGSFYVRVVALSALGAESSNEVVVRGGCASPPAPPSGLKTTVAGAQVAFTWTAPDAPVARYDLEVGTARGLVNLLTIALPGTATAFSAAAPPGTYAVRARAVNACGASAPSGSVVVVVGAAAALPAAPTGLIATAFRFQPRVDFTWTAPAGPVTGYVLEVGRAPGDATIGTFVLGPTTSLSVNGVPPGFYVVRLRAVNAAGTGPPTPDAGVRMPPF
jgi:hypothetical protein